MLLTGNHTSETEAVCLHTITVFSVKIVSLIQNSTSNPYHQINTQLLRGMYNIRMALSENIFRKIQKFLKLFFWKLLGYSLSRLSSLSWFDLQVMECWQIRNKSKCRQVCPFFFFSFKKIRDLLFLVSPAKAVGSLWYSKSPATACIKLVHCHFQEALKAQKWLTVFSRAAYMCTIQRED